VAVDRAIPDVARRLKVGIVGREDGTAEFGSEAIDVGRL
jgi:hypothetical protein